MKIFFNFSHVFRVTLLDKRVVLNSEFIKHEKPNSMLPRKLPNLSRNFYSNCGFGTYNTLIILLLLVGFCGPEGGYSWIDRKEVYFL